MAEMDFDYPSAPTLHEVFASARTFGLSEDEVWHVASQSQQWAGPDATIPEYLDELAGALARRIVIKERRTRSSSS